MRLTSAACGTSQPSSHSSTDHQCRTLWERLRASFASDVEISRHQLKQAGQRLSVIDVRAVGRIEITPRAGMDPMRLRSSGENRDSGRLFRSMKLLSICPEGSIFTASRPSVKSI